MPKEFKSYLNQTERIFQSIYSNGYTDGYNSAKEKYGRSKGVAHCKRATNEQIQKYGIDLWGWCDCGKAIEGTWVGLANFCPWCGKIMDWSNELLLNNDFPKE